MLCPACGVEVLSGAAFCHHCGARTSGEKSASPGAPNPFQPAAGEASENESPEIILWQGGYSPKAMLGGWCLCALLSLVAVVIPLVWTPNAFGWWMLGAVFFLPWLYYFLLLCYRKAGTRYVLTSQQLIHEHGVFRRDNNRIETLMMNDISFTQTLMQRLTGVGDLRILSGDTSHPTFVLLGIDSVKQVAEMFNNARREERRRHGVHVEQI